jgi:serine protease AprX
MCRMMYVVVILCFLVVAGCFVDPGSPSSGTHAADLFEPAYQAWAVHGPDGFLIASGIELEQPQATGALAVRSNALTEENRSVHPELAELLEKAQPDDVIEVLLAIDTRHKLSFLPRYDREREADDPGNLEIETQRLMLQNADDQLRAIDRRPIVEAIEQTGGQVTEEFRVGNVIAADLTVENLRELLEQFPQIIATSPAESEETPAAYQIDDGRDRQKSDLLEVAGYDGSGYRIGLLDTGVYYSHNVFNNPDPINLVRDCAYSLWYDCSFYPYSPYLYYYNASDPVGSGGHGTGMADILAGNENGGDSYRGVAPGALVDSMNVFSGTGHTTLSQAAVLRAFNYLDAYDEVIVANITANESENGTIALAADDLYDEGVIVVAPVGNVSPSTVKSPAIAHKVLGIGGYETSTGSDYSPQSGGTNGGGRYKPDVTAPTGINVASNSGASSYTYRSGTCPAAAFAGGAATLLRDYYDYRGWSSDPGAIYAAMITFGDEGGNSLDDNDGAGDLELGEVSSSAWLSGVKYLDPGEYQYVYFYVGSGACDLRAGIWWAEDYNVSHNKMELRLYQSSTQRAYSTHTNSVFQKVIYPYSMGSGWWKIKIDSYIYNNQDNIKFHYRTNC